MKIVCDRAKLLSAVQAAAEVAPARPVRPIAAGTLLEISKAGVELAATDFEVGLRCSLEVKSKEGEGQAVVNAAMLLAVIRDLEGKDVILEASPEKMVIKSGGSEARLIGMDPAEFPKVQGAGDDKPAKVPTAAVVGALDKVAYAAGQEESRYAINGVFLKMKKKDMELVATDTRRLAVVRLRLDKDTKIDRSAILPLKLVGLVKKLAAGQEEIGLGLRESEAVFVCGPAALSGRLVEGTYPKYEEAIPADLDRKVEVSKESLRGALKQATNFTTEDTRAVVVRLKKNKLEIEAKVAERGEANITLEAKYGGPEMEIAFNPQYLLDAIGRLEKESVTIELKDPARPAVIAEGKDYINVIMPVRLRGEGA